MVNRLRVQLFEGLFPHYCVFCSLRSYRQVPLCSACERDLPANHSCCTRCAIPLPDIVDPGTPRVCGNCLHTPPPFHRAVAPWLYNEQLAYLIHYWKFRGGRHLTPLLAALWQKQAKIPGSIDLIVPVPLHWRRRWQRGFNQADLLCTQLRAACPELQTTKIAHRMVRRERATAAQSGMSARRRAGNLQGAFTVRQPCDNLRIAIVDDVLTTGATAAAIAGPLRAAGASHIEVWCLARTPAPGCDFT